MIYYHQIGTLQCSKEFLNYFSERSLTIFVLIADDILVYRDKEHPEWMFSIDVTEDGKYLVMRVLKDCARVRYILLTIILTIHVVPAKSLMDCRL